MTPRPLPELLPPLGRDLDADRLLAALWSQVFWRMSKQSWWVCYLCTGTAPTKLAVRHAPGCALFSVPAATLAAVDAWEQTGAPE